MNLELLRLLSDFGLLVLIWLVQLVIYPSFLYFDKESLLAWHKKYTVGISLLVIPLLFGQLATAVLQLFEGASLYTTVSILFIGAVWVSTFTQFVPIHNKIAQGVCEKPVLQKLVTRNWLRTFLWTTIFIFSFLNKLF